MAQARTQHVGGCIINFLFNIINPLDNKQLFFKFRVLTDNLPENWERAYVRLAGHNDLFVEAFVKAFPQVDTSSGGFTLLNLDGFISVNQLEHPIIEIEDARDASGPRYCLVEELH